MKNNFFVLISLLCIFFISCTDKKNQKEIIISGTDSLKLPTQSELLDKADSKALKASLNKIDYDLTKMSSTMIYGQVFDMMIDPDSYIGKTLKMKGNFQVFENEENNERYYAIVIQDATACCQQGIEFIWSGEHTYPDDYPKIGDEITITGVYQVSYTEDDLMFNYLLTDDIECK